MAKKKVIKIKKVSPKEIFISLSGKKFDSVSDYLLTKLKGDKKTKFSLPYRIIEKGIKEKKKSIKLDFSEILKPINEKGISPNLLKNRKRGFLGLIDKGLEYEVRNPIIKNIPTGKSNNGTSDYLIKAELVKVSK